MEEELKALEEIFNEVAIKYNLDWIMISKYKGYEVNTVCDTQESKRISRYGGETIYETIYETML